MSNGDDRSGGSFRQEFDRLLKELGKPAIIELGKPEPKSKYLPRRRAAKCPATHNRMLIDGLADSNGDNGQLENSASYSARSDGPS